MMDFIRYIRYSYSKFKAFQKISRKYHRSTIHPSATIGPNVVLEGGNQVGKHVTIRGSVFFGRGSFINGPSHISAAPGTRITVGPFSSLAVYTSIFSGDHDIKALSTYSTKNQIYSSIVDSLKGKSENINIGADVWIGTHSIILKGVTIGIGSIIGAGTVVTRDVEPYSIVAGVPNKTIAMRFDSDKIEMLLDSQWWTWDDQRLSAVRSLFRCNVKDMNLKELENRLKNGE